MSTNITVKHLRAFISVARLNSFTRAAEELSLSQPALTMTIQQLEDMVGASLFDRTTRRVIPTPEGSDFIPVAERLLRDFDTALHDIRATAKMRRGHVGIASVHSVATRILPAALRGFSDTHPDISLLLRDGNSSEIRRLIRNNEVDIGFASIDADDPELNSAPLFRDQMGLLARADHPLFRLKRTLTWKDLADHDFLGLTEDTSTMPILRKIPNLPPSALSPRYQVSNITTLLAMLEAGIGVTTVAALTGLNHKKNPLEFRTVSGPVMWRTVYLITRRGRTLSRAAESIVALVGSHVERICAQSDLIETFLAPGDDSPRVKGACNARSSALANQSRI